MTITTCSNCKKEFNQKYFHKENKHHFCCKKCEAEFKKGKSTKWSRKYNKIRIEKDYAIIEIFNNVLGKIDCLIDIEDIEKIKEYYWNARVDKRHLNLTPYIETHKNKKRIHLHRFIMNCPNNMIVDHINGNCLDNRKINLRICNQKINACNRKSYRKLPVGIYIDTRKKNKKYTIYFKGKYLKSFSNLIEAKEYRKNYVEKYIMTISETFEINQPLLT